MLTATLMKAAITKESLTGTEYTHGVTSASDMKGNGTWERSKAEASGSMLKETAT